MPRILLVDDEPGILNVLGALLKSAGYEVVTARRADEAVLLARSQHFDVLLSDIQMEPIGGIELLTLLHKEQPGLTAIMLTAHGSVAIAVEAMRKGAFDYVPKPFKVDELLLTIRRALQFQQVMNESAQPRARLLAPYRLDAIVAESTAMRKICEMVKRIAHADTPVLICGESGTGKKLIAKTIHAHSRRKKGSFLAVNCATVSGGNLETELFGNLASASALAAERKPGLIAAAHGGTVLLENADELPMDQQARILLVLQEQGVRKDGGDTLETVDVRMIATTTANLEKRIDEGRFRDDLYRRFSALPLQIPPLRERRDDILALAEHFMQRELGAHANLFAIEPAAARALEHYSWPGNIRELEDTIQIALTFAKDGKVTTADLPPGILAAEPGPSEIPPHIADLRGRSLKSFLRATVQSAQNKAIANAR
jgi:DNA-binding NtrC family response regulator